MKNLDETQIPENLKILKNKVASTLSQKFILKWKGPKIPHGAKIGNESIGWTQHGVIKSKNGEIIGYYQRITEWGGDTKDEHEIMISCNDQLYDTKGDLCKTID
jgi:hypothetical protein